MNDKERQFLDRVRSELDESAKALDGKTLARLRRARSEALTKTKPWPLTAGWLPVGAFATVAVAVLAVTLWVRAPEPESLLLDDFELLTATEELDLFDELEFYQWLAGHDEAG